MGRGRWPLYSVLLVALLMLLGAGYLRRDSRGGVDVTTASKDSDSSPVRSSGSGLPVRGPRLAPGMSNPSSPPKELDDSSGGGKLSRAERAEAARQERALMAKTWGMSEDQDQAFEAAATAVPHLERKAVYEQFLRGEIDREKLKKELPAADARDSKELREVLGAHYQEYELMHGHFAEAGLDHKPFEPPTVDKRTE